MNADDLTLTDEWQAAHEQREAHDALLDQLARAVERDRALRVAHLRNQRDQDALNPKTHRS